MTIILNSFTKSFNILDNLNFFFFFLRMQVLFIVAVLQITVLQSFVFFCDPGFGVDAELVFPTAAFLRWLSSPVCLSQFQFKALFSAFKMTSLLFWML